MTPERLVLSASHVNIVLNRDAGDGSKIVLVDDGGADAVKFVVTSPADFAALLLTHAAQLKVVKLKGWLSEEAVTAFGPALHQALLLSGPVTVVTKGASFESAAAVAMVAQSFAVVKPGSTITPVKKREVVVDAATIPGLVGYLEEAMAASISPAAAGAAAGEEAAGCKMKAKFGRGVAHLVEPAFVNEVLAQPMDICDGKRVSSFTQVKLRGPLTPRAAHAIRAILGGIPSVTSVKLARYWVVGNAAHELALALCGAAAAGAQLSLAAKKKGTEGAQLGIASSTLPSEVEDAVRRCAGEPSA